MDSDKEALLRKYRANIKISGRYSLIKSDIGAQILRFQGVRLLTIGLVLMITVCVGVSNSYH